MTEKPQTDNRSEHHRFFTAASRAALVFPAFLLVVVACSQLVVAHTSHLSPWKGGGFGMFSTINSPGERFLRIDAVYNDGVRHVEIPSSMTHAAKQLIHLPSAERTENFAQGFHKYDGNLYEINSNTKIPKSTKFSVRLHQRKWLPKSGVVDSEVLYKVVTHE